MSVISCHAVCKFPAPSVIGQHRHQLIESRAEVYIIAQHFPHAEYTSTFKMEEFIQGIMPNMTSTQVCDVCCCNIDNVAHDVISYTNGTNVFTMDIRSRSSLLIVDMVGGFFLWIYLCIY